MTTTIMIYILWVILFVLGCEAVDWTIKRFKTYKHFKNTERYRRGFH